MNRTRVFLDTSAIFEAADRSGRRHAEAAAVFGDLLAARASLFTSTAVLAELHGLTLSRIGPAPALALADRIATSDRVELLEAGSLVLHDGLALLRARPGRRLSLVDASSFVLMRANAIDTAFAVDADFTAEGFSTLP